MIVFFSDITQLFFSPTYHLTKRCSKTGSPEYSKNAGVGLQDRFSSVWYEGKQNHSESKKGPCVFELYAHVVAQQTVKIEQGDHVRKTCQKRTHCLNPTGFHSYPHIHSRWIHGRMVDVHSYFWRALRELLGPLSVIKLTFMAISLQGISP